MSTEKEFDVYWEGPFGVDEFVEAKEEDHEFEYAVLYMLCGTHGLYGRHVPLYIGRSDRGIQRRILQHKKIWLTMNRTR